MTHSERYKIARDNDGHWYVIPEGREAEWGEWLALDREDVRAWDHPNWAKGIGGSPSLLTFTDPVIE